MRRGKKQDLAFKGINKAGRVFVTPDFIQAVDFSVNDPVPCNRKSRRAMAKIIRCKLKEK